MQINYDQLQKSFNVNNRLFNFLLSLSLATSVANAQLGINNTPHASAMFDVSGNNKGLLIPRISSAQRLAIANPANGLLVYDTDRSSFVSFKTGSGWADVDIRLPFTASASSFTPLFSILNNLPAQPAVVMDAASGNAIAGTASGTYSGIFGQNDDNGKGVSGLNTGTGHGVHARGVNGTALFADIPTGTGTAGYFKQLNPGGKALEIDGNLKISGANMEEGLGKVLLSGNDGVSIWAMPESGRIHVAFVTNGLNDNTYYANSTWTRYQPKTVDYNNVFAFRSAPQSPSNAFVTPIKGFYKFSANFTFAADYGNSERLVDCYMRLQMKRGNIVTTIAQAEKEYGGAGDDYGTDFLTFSTHTYLQEGDEVWLEIRQNNAGASTILMYTQYAHFSGHLVWADE